MDIVIALVVGMVMGGVCGLVCGFVYAHVLQADTDWDRRRRAGIG